MAGRPSTRRSTTGAASGPGTSCWPCCSGPGSGSVGVPSLASTDYINTIPPEAEPWFPGDEEAERALPAPGSAGTPRSWCTARSGRASPSAGTSPPTPPVRPCTRSGSTTSSAARTTPGGGDQVFFQGHASPGMYARAFLEGRLSDRPARRVPAGEVPSQRWAAVLPAPAPDARLLGVPHRLDGARSAQRHLPGPVQQVPARPWDQGHLPPAGLGVPRRRRDGRAGGPRRAATGRLRGAGQPHLRGELQPAAAGRSGARERQDHPGAGVDLPGRRLERHQGDLGPGVGSAARRGPGRRAGEPHERHPRRRLPDLPGRGRRVHPGELLRP